MLEIRRGPGWKMAVKGRASSSRHITNRRRMWAVSGLNKQTNSRHKAVGNDSPIVVDISFNLLRQSKTLMMML